MDVTKLSNMENYPIKYIGRDGKKHAKCKTCGRDWLIGRKGGGMVYQAAIRHTTACKETIRATSAAILKAEA